MNSVGALFDLFGMKLYRITRERVYAQFDDECLRELESEPNVERPLDLMIQGLENDSQLPLVRYKNTCISMLEIFRVTWNCMVSL